MKKFLIALILCSASFTALSQSFVDGMSFQNLPSNRSKYYYGEPIILHFLTKNETDKIKRYWEPATSINVQLELVDLRSGKTYYNAHEYPGYDLKRKYWVDNPPPVEASFSQMDTKFLNYILGDRFRLDKLFVNKGSEVLYRYARVLPVGKYSLRLTYFLLPSKHQLAVRHEFEVVSVPGSEKEAFHDYEKAF